MPILPICTYLGILGHNHVCNRVQSNCLRAYLLATLAALRCAVRCRRGGDTGHGSIRVTHPPSHAMCVRVPCRGGGRGGAGAVFGRVMCAAAIKGHQDPYANVINL